jgi:O-antigen/teichoic acid export membrane protein
VSLKEKTFTALGWSFFDNFANQGIQFVVGIILARLLTPREFGLIGMIVIFIGLSESFVNSGFSQALIRRRRCSEEDYSTVFYFNVAAGILLYLTLFFLAGSIGRFYREPNLVGLIRVLGLGVVISSLGLTQRAILTRNINFKLLARISIISSLISGSVGVGMAYCGWGVWSLVSKTLSQNFVIVGLLWIWNKWKPVFTFSVSAFREMFSFGSKLLLSGLINTFHINVYYLIIGKYFSAVTLGYYTRADQFKSVPSSILTEVVGRVAFPVLASVQDDEARLKSGYKKLIKCTTLVSFVCMMGMAAVAEPMIRVLIGDKWVFSVPYLQLLCFSGMLYPLHALNLDMLNVKGRSDLFLRLEIIKQILLVPTIITGIFLGIKLMIAAMILTSIIAYFLNSYWSGAMVGYSPREQIIDIMPSFIIAAAMGICVFVVGYLLPLKPIIVLLVQLSIGALFVIGVAKAVRLDAYLEVKEFVSDRFQSLTRASGDEPK